MLRPIFDRGAQSKRIKSRSGFEVLLRENGRPARSETGFRMKTPCATHRRDAWAPCICGTQRGFFMRLPCRGALLLLLALALTGAGCGKKHARAGKPLPAVSVRVQTIEAKPHVASEDVVATVNAKLRSVIESKISGRIDKMLVTDGQKVKAGDLLVQLDVREIQAKLDQATPVREQAEKDLKRFTDLLAKRVITQQEFESAQAKVRVARAAVIEAETMLGYAKVTAPFDGVITRKLADVGDLATPGKPLVEMEDPAALRLEAAVPEAIIDRVSLGSKLMVRIGQNELEGVVREMSPTADPNSRTLLVKLDLPPTPGLRTGQFGRVAVPVAETSVLRVPAAAVIRRGQMELVFVRDGNHARLRIVKTGKPVGEEIEVVSGVNAGEEVITDGVAGLADGQPIEIKP